MRGARVLVVLNTNAAWSRGILRGFMAAAQERGWVLLHYHPPVNLDWLTQEWAPNAAVVGPEFDAPMLARLGSYPLVSLPGDVSDQGVASVCLDESKIGALALEHFLERGHRHVSCFRFDDHPFAVARERAFLERAAAAKVQVASGWWVDGAEPPRNHEDARAIAAWLRDLPKPCGVFACTDSWGRVVARYARAAGLRIPEDIALVGVDNDPLECELIAPPLSSIMIPWPAVGRKAADLVHQALKGKVIVGKRTVLAPIGVLARRSSDALAIEDDLVATAANWIRANSDRRLTVPTVARALGSSRQRLERRFRSILGRTVQEEIRRAHVERAMRLLQNSDAGMVEIAKKSGFTTAALLSVAFQRELGMPPGAYRRRVKEALGGGDD